MAWLEISNSGVGAKATRTGARPALDERGYQVLHVAHARRAPALHGQIRRSQSAGRNPGDGGAQASVLRHRVEYRAGRSSRRHSGGSVLSGLAGFVAKSRESIEPEINQ